METAIDVQFTVVLSGKARDKFVENPNNILNVLHQSLIGDEPNSPDESITIRNLKIQPHP